MVAWGDSRDRALAGSDRKTVRRYVAAIELGYAPRRRRRRGAVVGRVPRLAERAVRSHRLYANGSAWRVLEQHRDQVQARVEKDDPTTVKVGQFLARRAAVVPTRTLDRFVRRCGVDRAVTGPGGHRARRSPGRESPGWAAAGAPAREPQVDLRRMGVLPGTGGRAASGRPRPDPDRVRVPVLVRVALVRADHRRGDRGVRGGPGLFRRGVPRRDPDNLAPVIATADPRPPSPRLPAHGRLPTPPGGVAQTT